MRLGNPSSEEIIVLANEMVRKQTTVRELAKEFKISKSCVHYRLTKMLKHLDYNLYKQVRMLLDKNLQERAIRGGNALKAKYLKQTA